MKTLTPLLTLLLALALMPASALAQSSGAYLVGGLTMHAATGTDLGAEALDGEALRSDITLGKSKTSGTLAAGYLFVPSASFVVMLEAGKDFGTDMSLTSRVEQQEPDFSTDTATRRWQLKRDWYLAIKPGWRVTPATTVYLSLARHTGSANLSSDVAIDCIATSCSYSNTESARRRTHGTGIGLGVMSMVSDNWFVRAEIERIDFDKVSFTSGDVGNVASSFTQNELKASSVVGRVMVGWRF